MSESAKKRKPASSKPSETYKRKKTGEHTKAPRSTIDLFLEGKAVVGSCPKQETASGQDNFESMFRLPPGSGVNHGLDASNTVKLNTQALCNFPKHKEPHLDFLIVGAVKFGGSRLIEDKALESL